jgi:hypothetical protein
MAFCSTVLWAAQGKPEPPPVGQPYSGFATLCGMLDPGVYTEDDHYAHLRDAVMLYRIVTDSPYVTGWETLVMNYDLKVKSGKGTSWGSLTMEPDTFTGYYTEDWVATAKRFEWDISGEYLGSGDLAGVTVTYQLTQASIGSVPADTCGGGPIFDVQMISGYIVLPD